MFDIYDTQRGTPPIPESELNDEEVIKEIFQLKKELKDQIIILGHHYQQDDIIQFADIKGDSLELAKKISQYPDTPYILFCGVHFMAETANMLSQEKQKVILPDMDAGCFLADTAKLQDVEEAWAWFKENTQEKIIPITYINSAASLKAFVGKNGGAICTSSNAEQIIKWAFENGQKLLFFPDQHLGRNTCFKMGTPLERMKVYDPSQPNGGLSPEDIQNSQVLLWYGYCSVHQGFTPEQIAYVRKNAPDTTVLVHPECSFEVVSKADLAGSTSYIIQQVEKAPSGSRFAIGTEINLVNRLAAQYPDKEISSLSPFQCLCTTMYRIRPRWLLETLRSIKRKEPINLIKVPQETTHYAIKALDRMLSIL